MIDATRRTALTALLLVTATLPVSAGEPSAWTQRLDLGGDLRLRHDTQWRTEGTNAQKFHRNRERIRLRLNMKFKTTESTEVGVRLVTGQGLPNSTNQTLDGHATAKNIYVDRAYATWQALDGLEITGGKFKNPLFTSQLVWDSDINLEGLTESFVTQTGGGTEVFAHLGQWVIEEVNVKDTNKDPALLAYQVGATIKPEDNVTVKLGTTYYDFLNLDVLTWAAGRLDDRGDFLGANEAHSQQMIFDADGRLLNTFGCWEAQAEVKVAAGAQPLAVFGSFVRNLDADVATLVDRGVDPGDSDPAELSAYGGDPRDSGWLAGASVGAKKKRGDWSLKYQYQEIEDYAFPAIFVDSDVHGGGTNNRGHLVQVRYRLADNIQAQATGFVTERQDERKDGRKDEDRIQLDWIISF